jgi:hypothetical protein
MRKLRRARKAVPIDESIDRELSQILRPAIHVRDSFSTELEKRLLRALSSSSIPQRPDAGSLDDATRSDGIYVARVESPDAGSAIVADIEEIDDSRSHEILSQVDQLLRRTVNVQDGR